MLWSVETDLHRSVSDRWNHRCCHLHSGKSMSLLETTNVSQFYVRLTCKLGLLVLQKDFVSGWSQVLVYSEKLSASGGFAPLTRALPLEWPHCGQDPDSDSGFGLFNLNFCVILLQSVWLVQFILQLKLCTLSVASLGAGQGPSF